MPTYAALRLEATAAHRDVREHSAEAMSREEAARELDFLARIIGLLATTLVGDLRR